MIEVNGLTKSFGVVRALDGLDMHVEHGSIYGLVGPNGAGKTTVLQHVAGVMRPDAGTVLVDGAPVYEQPQVKERIAYVPSDFWFFRQARIADMRELHDSLFSSFDVARFDQLAAELGLEAGRAVRTLSKGMRMRWRVNGDTLQIQYDKPGFHLFSMFPHKKELTVTLPKSLILESAKISATSADLNIPALRADRLILKATSGDVLAAAQARSIQCELTSGDLALQVMEQADEISIKSASGNITLDSQGADKKVEVSTISGTIQAAIGQADAFKAHSTSGDIHAVIGDAKKTDIESTSGTIVAELSAMEALNVSSTSGDVTAYLPTEPGSTARVETVSGRFTHQLPLAAQDKDYVAGDGSGSVKLHTTSGDITLNEKTMP
ncbi:MAG: DUF4097 family beta strand repeat protein [Oscillospiraceae bacterium]|nr:DUF4097 family beta strand repeat protein [Oscillospiraceae bacterium]